MEARLVILFQIHLFGMEGKGGPAPESGVVRSNSGTSNGRQNLEMAAERQGAMGASAEERSEGEDSFRALTVERLRALSAEKQVGRVPCRATHRI